MTKRILILSLSLSLLGACGSAPASSETEEQHSESAGGEHEHDHEHGEGDEGGHHHVMSPELHAFHDVFAPIYHMDPGAERAQAACGAAAQFQQMAPGVDAAASEGLAEGSPEAEMHQTTAAQEAAGQLSQLCGAERVDEAAVLQALESIHDAFHHAMEEWGEHHAEVGHEHHGHRVE